MPGEDRFDNPSLGLNFLPAVAYLGRHSEVCSEGVGGAFVFIPAVYIDECG